MISRNTKFIIKQLSIYLIIFCCCLMRSFNCVELTFELADNAKQCFYEEIKQNQSVTFEYQVVTGGSYDVDIVLLNPKQEPIYKEIKKQFDTFEFTATLTGIYAACFSNEFSTFTHKLVYMDLQIGEDTLFSLEDHATALTQLETSAADIHKSLSSILDYQTHHRLRESQGRKRAEEINETVLYWSMFETVFIVTLTIVEVYILKNFFTERKPSQATVSGNYRRL